MIIYPAIDLINGQCVRLYKGDFDQQTTYDGSPIEVAKSYQADGAEWLHLVDLDGARDPAKRQTSTIRDIITATGLKVQTGGGIRNTDDVQILLDAGASRIVIGSLAVKAPEITSAIFKKFGGDVICLATDVMPQKDEYMIAVSGWQEESTVSLSELITRYIGDGLQHILCTDISRDGTMEGCNIDLYKDLKKSFPDLFIQASGGVNGLDDLRALNSDGVIIGKALYEGTFTVKQAIEVASC